jgi:hypothetical protein
MRGVTQVDLIFKLENKLFFPFIDICARKNKILWSTEVVDLISLFILSYSKNFSIYVYKYRYK